MMLEPAIVSPAEAADRPGSGAGRGAVSRPLLLCFSHLRWDFVWQRPQHLLTRAAASYDVIFVEEPVRRPVSTPELEVSTRRGGVRVALPVLPDGMDEADGVRAQRRLVEDLLAGTRPRVLWFYTPMAVPLAAGLEADVVVYDNMDELSAFRGASPEMLANEAELFRRADLVFTGGMSLYEAKRGRHPRVFAHPSSIDTAHFAAARLGTEPDPPDQAPIGRPRLGFFGVIDERMDIDLVRALAGLRPDWQVVMVGPVVKIDPATLPRPANVHWLGPKSYDVLPSYLAGWDVGLMPFALNESTRFISPTKTPEFLAAGLPVVSTAIADVVRPYGEAGLVDIVADASGMAAAVERSLVAPRADWLARVDRHLERSSWDGTWAAMNRTIEQALSVACAEAGTGRA